MTTYEILTLIIAGVSTVAVVSSVTYMALQFKRSAAIHKQNLEWNVRIETRKKLDDYNRLESAICLNEKLKFMGKKHAIPIATIKQAIDEDHKVIVHISRLLNYYEGLANGIENAIYNEHLIKSSKKGAMISMYTSFQEFIEYDRKEGNPLIWIKFEALINRWIDEDRNDIDLKKLGKV